MPLGVEKLPNSLRLERIRTFFRGLKGGYAELTEHHVLNAHQVHQDDHPFAQELLQALAIYPYFFTQGLPDLFRGYQAAEELARDVLKQFLGGLAGRF